MPQRYIEKFKIIINFVVFINNYFPVGLQHVIWKKFIFAFLN